MRRPKLKGMIEGAIGPLKSGCDSRHWLYVDISLAELSVFGDHCPPRHVCEPDPAGMVAVVFKIWWPFFLACCTHLLPQFDETHFERVTI